MCRYTKKKERYRIKRSCCNFASESGESTESYARGKMMQRADQIGQDTFISSARNWGKYGRNEIAFIFRAQKLTRRSPATGVEVHELSPAEFRSFLTHVAGAAVRSARSTDSVVGAGRQARASDREESKQANKRASEQTPRARWSSSYRKHRESTPTSQPASQPANQPASQPACLAGRSILPWLRRATWRRKKSRRSRWRLAGWLAGGRPAGRLGD